MKKLTLFVLGIITHYHLIAQNVGIGTATPHASAKLEVSSTTQGILVPRMTTTERNAISSPAAGLLVYDTNTNSFWFFIAGFGWSNLSPSSTSWLLTGNSGTDTTVNFVGTLDNKPLKFKVNNQRAGLIGINGNIFLGPGSGTSNSFISNNIAIGANSLTKSSYNETIAIGSFAMNNNISGAENLAVGSHALEVNINSGFNTAIGNYNLGLHTTGSANTAIGASVLGNHLRGSRNTAVGTNANFYDTTGNDNTSLGYFGLFNNLNGSRNTALGTQALAFNTKGNSNLGVGYKAETLYDSLQNASAIGALSRVDCNDCLVLGSVNGVNGASSNINVGIGINKPTRPLSFPAAIGKKISLYPGASGDVGLGVFPNELRIHSDYSFADITFGYDDYTAGFTERMRIKNIGELSMELNGRIAMRNGTVPLDLNYGPGIWLTRPDNSSYLGFIGVQNNQNMGFYGGPAGWGFVYDAINSRVGISTPTPSEKLQVAGNVKADNFIYTAPKTFFHSIHPSAFKPFTNTHNTYSNFHETYYNTTTPFGSFVTPLYLPHGATVTSATVYFYDNSASADLIVYFSYKALGSTTTNYLAILSNTGTPGNSNLTTSSISSPLINNQLYSYFITAASEMSPFAADWPGANLKIRDIVISYTQSNAQ